MAGNYLHGKYPSLDPDAPSSYSEVSTGYTLRTSQLGSVTSTETAMQLNEVEMRMREGLQNVEVSIINPKIFEAIPKEHFKEMNRLSKIAGAKTSLHAPLIDPSGFDERENRWGGEEGRQNAERQFKSIIERSMHMDPQGNIPVVIHAAGVNVQAREWSKYYNKKTGKDEIMLSTMTAVNQETGQMMPFKREVREYALGGVKPEERSPMERIQTANATDWQNNVIKVTDMLKETDNFIEKANRTGAMPIVNALRKGEIKPEDLEGEALARYQQYRHHIANAESYSDEARMRLRALYDSAMKYSPKEVAINMRTGKKTSTQAILAPIQKSWAEEAEKRRKGKESASDSIEKRNQLYYDTLRYLGELENAQFGKKFGDEKIGANLVPELYKPVEDFAREHASKTLSNVAVDAAWDPKKKRFKKNYPIIAIENVWPHIAFSRADELKKLIKQTRKDFVKTAVKQGANRDEAIRTSKKMIGATWDVGHINNLRKYGFKEKEIIKESERIAKFVKHAHIHDNFGFDDSHLPVGTGTTPLKKIFGKLKEAGFDGRAIIEGGGYAAQFKGHSPQPYSLEALNAPIYYPGIGGPTWGEEPGYSAHFSGYGRFLPDQHFAMYGGGFSQLPVELGGQVAGRGGRFSGTPME